MVSFRLLFVYTGSTYFLFGVLFMRDTTYLDVLVVYSSGVAISASAPDSLSQHPFLLTSKQSNYNSTYEYFLDACRKHGITAGFTTSSDIIGAGLCDSYWSCQFGIWKKEIHRANTLQVFDKVSPVTTKRSLERNLLLSHQSVKPFNNLSLFNVFFDKFQTYKKLPEYAVPTVNLHSNELTSIMAKIERLNTLIKKHKFSDDFSNEIVMKDRYGSGGYYVFKIENDFAVKIREIMLKHKDIRFIIQPFLNFDNGYQFKKNRTSTDIRLIYHQTKLLQCYIRMAKKNDFLCNEHQGGELVYVSKEDIPSSILKIAKKINKRIGDGKSLYALDFVMSNLGRPYFLEGNTGPGLDWDVKKKVNEIKSKQLIDSIVKDLAIRISYPFTSILPKMPIISYDLGLSAQI